MSRWDAWLLHLSTLAVGGTGLVYAWMRYFSEPKDPFAVIHHPWQPMVHHLHLWTAPALVFAVGLIWRQHIWQHWRRGVRPGRRSGLTVMTALTPMVASGYLIQTTIAEAWRIAWVAIHLATSVAWVIGYLGHAAAQRRRPARARRPAQRFDEPLEAPDGTGRHTSTAP